MDHVITLENVINIELQNCKYCSELPRLGQLPLLRKLVVTGMDNVEYIDSVAGGREGFPSLEILHISFLPNLKALSRQHGKDLFPRLRQMNIQCCPELSLQYLPSLEELDVRGGCIRMLLNSIANLSSSITHDELDHVTNNKEEEEAVVSFRLRKQKTPLLESAVSFPKDDRECLIALRTLRISDCHELESFPEQALRGLGCLRCLEIGYCPMLRSFSGGLRHLTALESLEIHYCPLLNMDGESFKEMTSLRHCSFPMSPLPEALQDAPALQNLRILDFQGLELPEWLGNLTSLGTLCILSCPNIASLPFCIQSLTKLKALTMLLCNPELKRRCEKDKGEDWHKIAHIPEFRIGYSSFR